MSSNSSIPATNQKFSLSYLTHHAALSNSRQTPTATGGLGDISSKVKQRTSNDSALHLKPKPLLPSDLDPPHSSLGIYGPSTDSPTETKFKAKLGVQRKGHQVSQSQNFNKFKNANNSSSVHQVNKSFDAAASSEMMGQRQQVNYAGQQHTPSSMQGVKGNQPSSIVQQFQSLQQVQQTLHQKRNLSLGQQNQQHKTHLSNERQPSKPGSRLGTRSTVVAAATTNDGSRGSRFITSNNRRPLLEQEDNKTLATMMDKQTPATIQVPQAVSRPKTSFGKSSYLDRQAQLVEGGEPDQQLQQDYDQMVADITTTNAAQSNIKTNNSASTQQKSFIIKKGERNEGLRSYLRKSLDSNNPLQAKVSSDNVALNFSSLNLPQNDSALSQNKGHQGSKSNINKIKRKRDYSKVGVPLPQNIPSQGFILQPNQGQVLQNVFSPQKSGKNGGQVKKNLYQEQFATMEDPKRELIHKVNQINQSLELPNAANFSTLQPSDDIKSKHARKALEKTHQRSQTSHKLNRTTQSRESQHFPGVSQLKNSSIQDQNNEALLTLAPAPDKPSRSEERPQSKYKTQHQQQQQQTTSNFANLRASITKEVTTSHPQQQQDQKKFDNCVSKFAFATKTGFSPSNPYKVNQDSFLALPHLGEYRRTHFFAVCDGHGVYGKEVSEFIKNCLAQKVEIQIKQIFDMAKQAQRVVDSNEVKDALATSFTHVTHQLYNSSGIDIYFSGSTCVSILVVGNKIFCANVGDSRAVLARANADNGMQLQGYPLNRDHKGTEPDEERRILQHGGRIEAFKDSEGRPMGPPRVWHKDQNIPGLAMTRSFGDHCAAEVGCIADPEILELNLTEQDKFIVVASDGVWEFLSNDEVVNIVKPHYLVNSAEKAAEALIREALKKWKQEENVVDDITCIIIFLSIQ